jgi:hypothetical protein
MTVFVFNEILMLSLIVAYLIELVTKAEVKDHFYRL